MIVGIILGYLTCKMFNYELYYGFFSLLGSILPDLDWHWNRTKFHRKAFLNFHNLFAMVIFSFIWGSKDYRFGLLFAIGYLSHLLIDRKVPWLYPFKKYKTKYKKA